MQGNWTSEGFMKVAKGPLTPVFHWMLYDGDGLARLDQAATLQTWDQFQVRIADHYRFDEDQAKLAEKTVEQHVKTLETFYLGNEEELDTYFKGLDRRAEHRSSPERQEVTSLRDQATTIEKEQQKMLGPWLKEVQGLWVAYEGDMNAIATEEQAKRGWLSLPTPGRKLLDTKFIDQIIPYFDLIVGVLLILGLCTRLSALAGAVFLFSIILTQWPWAPDAIPAYYQIIEMHAMLVLAAVGAGRWAGLDFFIDLLWRRCCPPKTEKKA